MIEAVQGSCGARMTNLERIASRNLFVASAPSNIQRGRRWHRVTLQMRFAPRARWTRVGVGEVVSFLQDALARGGQFAGGIEQFGMLGSANQLFGRINKVAVLRAHADGHPQAGSIGSKSGAGRFHAGGQVVWMQGICKDRFSARRATFFAAHDRLRNCLVQRPRR